MPEKNNVHIVRETLRSWVGSGHREADSLFTHLKMNTIVQTFYRRLVVCADALRSPLLLVIRLFWGWQFFLTGKGKLMNLSRTSQFFESLGIPFPHGQALLAACTECFGGLLLLLGLASRLISLPLLILLTVAYCTADLDRVRVIFSDPDKFVTADEFLFLFAVTVVFVFGPGKISIDTLVAKYFKGDDTKKVNSRARRE
jgi:putative oxidoreductase